VHKRLLCKHSAYCKERFAFKNDERKAKLDLSELEPRGFQLFLQWMYSNATRMSLTYKIPTREWKLFAGEAYAVGHRLNCPAFMEFSMEFVIKFISDYDLIDMEYLYRNTAPDAALREFCNQWVLFQSNLNSRLWRSTTVPEMKAHMEMEALPYDPRTIFANHWYDCFHSGNLKPTCRHVFIVGRPMRFRYRRRRSDLSLSLNLTRAILKARTRSTPWRNFFAAAIAIVSCHQVKGRVVEHVPL
jgi:BTB/POZ domain